MMDQGTLDNGVNCGDILQKAVVFTGTEFNDHVQLAHFNRMCFDNIGMNIFLNYSDNSILDSRGSGVYQK